MKNWFLCVNKFNVECLLGWSKNINFNLTLKTHENSKCLLEFNRLMSAITTKSADKQ